MNPYKWVRGEHTNPTTRLYTITRNDEPIATTTLNCTIPFHSWVLANWCDALWEIERANGRDHLHAVANFADQQQRRKEAAS